MPENTPTHTDKSCLTRFLDEKIFEAKGFQYYEEITRTLCFFDVVQRELGIYGCVGEIGVADGALFVPLALCCRSDEIAVAIDVFDDLDRNWNPSGGQSSLPRLKTIISNCIGDDDQVRYLCGDSFYIGPETLRSVTGGKGFRLFSIDGAHSVHHTVSDLRLAGEVINPGGIVMLDDIKNWGWPGVVDGFARYMLLSDYQRLVPFFLYGNKLMLTTPGNQEFYLAKTVELAKQYGLVAEKSYRISKFFGSHVVGWG